jgi:hypothetical protein
MSESTEKTIRGAIEVKFRPWAAPNFAAIAGDGRSEPKAEGVPVADLEAATLDAPAEAWLKDLYAKAGKKNPWAARTERM